MGNRSRDVCPKCDSRNTDHEWGDDNHGNFGDVYWCKDCRTHWDDRDDMDELYKEYHTMDNNMEPLDITD